MQGDRNGARVTRRLVASDFADTPCTSGRRILGDSRSAVDVDSRGAGQLGSPGGVTTDDAQPASLGGRLSLDPDLLSDHIGRLPVALLGTRRLYWLPPRLSQRWCSVRRCLARLCPVRRYGVTLRDARCTRPWCGGDLQYQPIAGAADLSGREARAGYCAELDDERHFARDRTQCRCG